MLDKNAMRDAEDLVRCVMVTDEKDRMTKEQILDDLLDWCGRYVVSSVNCIAFRNKFLEILMKDRSYVPTYFSAYQKARIGALDRMPDLLKAILAANDAALNAIFVQTVVSGAIQYLEGGNGGIGGVLREAGYVGEASALNAVIQVADRAAEIRIQQAEAEHQAYVARQTAEDMEKRKREQTRKKAEEAAREAEGGDCTCWTAAADFALCPVHEGGTRRRKKRRWEY